MSTKSYRRVMTKKITAVLSSRLLGLVALTWLVVEVRAWRAPVSAPASEAVPAVVDANRAPLQRQRRIADFESELITITPHGFEPQEITRPQGRFLLMIDNRSGVAATALALTSEAGRRTHDMRVPREEPNWSEAVELRPGHYVLTEVDHPRWSCRITITAQ